MDRRAQASLDYFKESVGELQYRNVSVFGLLRLPAFLEFKNYYGIHHTSWQRLRGFLAIALRLAAGLVYPLLRGIKRGELKGLKDCDIVFVIDHNRPVLLEMSMEVFREFSDLKSALCTTDANIASKLRDQFAQTVIAPESARQIFGGKEHWNSLWQFVRAARKLNAYLLLSMVQSLVRSMQYVDFYRQLLAEGRPKAIVTLCDLHNHEFAVTSVANELGIHTYTLQHGMAPDAPVISERIFVWGEVSRRELMKLGVAESKIVISGRLQLDNIVNSYLPRKNEVRAAFVEEYGFDPKKPIVVYFATNWGERENRGLFKCFSSILDQDVSILVKLRPNFGEVQRIQYQRWLQEWGARRVPIVIEEDIYRIFTACDLLVTCHSGAAVEAMPFETVSVILDIFPEMNLSRLLPHYQDCVVVHSSQELDAFVDRICADPEYLISLKRQSMAKAGEYYANQKGRSSTKLVSHEIRQAL